MHACTHAQPETVDHVTECNCRSYCNSQIVSFLVSKCRLQKPMSPLDICSCNQLCNGVAPPAWSHDCLHSSLPAVSSVTTGETSFPSCVCVTHCHTWTIFVSCSPFLDPSVSTCIRPFTCRLQLCMEDGSVPEVTGYYNNLNVACTHALGQSVAMSCRPEGTRVVCEPVEPHTCEAVTTYKASVCCEHCRDTDRTG